MCKRTGGPQTSETLLTGREPAGSGSEALVFGLLAARRLFSTSGSTYVTERPAISRPASLWPDWTMPLIASVSSNSPRWGLLQSCGELVENGFENVNAGIVPHGFARFKLTFRSQPFQLSRLGFLDQAFETELSVKKV